METNPPPVSVRLQACQPIDVADCFAAPVGTLTQAQHATCMCLHPTKPLLAVAAGRSFAVYDLLTCTRLTRHDIQCPTVEMAFSPDGVMLVMVLQDWVVLGLSLATWNAHLLVSRREKPDKSLDSCLLAISGGARPSLFYCRHGKESVRRAALTSADIADAKGRPTRAKGEGSWGAKVKLEPARPIIGLCVMPGEILLVAHADGVLRGYSTQASQEAQQPLFQVSVQAGQTSSGGAVPKSLPAAGTLLVAPHPTQPTTSLIIQAARLGSLCVMMMPAGGTQPGVLFKGTVPGLHVLLGAGVLQDLHQLVVLGLSDSGRVRAVAWSLTDVQANQDLPTMYNSKVEPADIGALLDPRFSKHHLLLPPPIPSAPPPSSTSGHPNQPSHYTPNAFDNMLGLAAPSGGKQAEAAALTAASAATVAAVNALGGLVNSLWSPTPAWAQSLSHSSVMLGPLMPLVARVLVHPVLPIMAVQLEPSVAVQTSGTMIRYPLAGASPEEYMMSRRVLSVPLLCANSWDSPVTAIGTHAQVAHMHTTLQHWTPTATTVPVPTLPAPASAAAATSNGQPAPAPAPFHVPGIPLSEPRVTLPGYMFFISNSALCRYSLANKATTTLVSLPNKVPGGGVRRVHAMSYSKAGAWLIFFEVVGGPPGQDRWQWTLILASQLDSPVWLKPGKYGAFLGPTEEYFAVVDPSGELAAVFSVAECNHVGAAPEYLYSLEGLGLQGVSLPVFTGPHRDYVVDPAATAVLGCVMWQTASGGLAARPLPAVLATEGAEPVQHMPQQRNSPYAGPTPPGGGGPRRPTALPISTTYYSSYNEDGSSTEEEDVAEEEEEDAPGEPKGTGAVAPGSNLGPLGHKYWLPLLQGELVLQVAWQQMSWTDVAKTTTASQPAETVTETAANGKDDDDSSDYADEEEQAQEVSKGRKRKDGDEPEVVIRGDSKGGPTIGAILTNQRVILVTEMLNQLASLPFHEHINTALPVPATSMLWVGPALLVLLVDGRVLQFTWAGAVHQVCHVAPHHTTALVGATPDSLMFLRQVQPRDGHSLAWEVVCRPTSLLQPLVLGWSSLSVLPDPKTGNSLVAECRRVIQATLQQMDPLPVTSSIVWGLLGTCALDLAHSFASSNEFIDMRAFLASAAASGRWDEVQQTLAAEFERSGYHPTPPPSGCALHSKLLAAAGGAVAHGQMGRACNLLQMAGEWQLALVVAAAGGDTQALYRVASEVGQADFNATSGRAAEAAAAQRMASVLNSVYGSSARSTSDAKLSLVTPDGATCYPAPGGWELGSRTSTLQANVEVIQMEGMRAEEGELVSPTTGEHPLVSALALDPAAVKALNLRIISASTDGAAQSGDRPGRRGLTTSSSSLTHSPSLGVVQASAASGAALDDIFGYANVTGRDEFGGSLRTTSTGSASDSDLSTSATPTKAWKGKVSIREKGSTPSLSNNADQLRDAMKSLKLAPPGSGPSTPGPNNSSQPGSPLGGLAPIPVVGQGLNPLANVEAAPVPVDDDIFDLKPVAAKAPAAPGPMEPAGQPLQVLPGAPGAPQPVPAAVQPVGLPAQQQQFVSQGGAVGVQGVQGVSPALSAGMVQPSPAAVAPAAPTAQGLSPALAAGTRQQPAPPPRPAPAYPAFQGLSPALAAGMTQPAKPNPPFQGLSPALAAGMVGATAPAAAPAPAAPAAPAPAAAAAVTPGNPDTLYHEGVGFLEAGNWAAADERFSRALAALKQQPADAMQRTKVAFCAQYLAAVQLVGVAGAGTGPKEAKLYRYAAALQLDSRHRVALTREALNRNKMQMNFRYCADAVTWLITTLAGTVPDAALQPMQQEISEFERAGGRNTNVPADEDLPTFAQLVTACSSKQEVDQLVQPIIQYA